MTGQQRIAQRLTAGYVRSFDGGGYISLDGQYARDRAPRETNYGLRLAGGLVVRERFELVPEAGLVRGALRSETYVRMGVRLRLGSRTSARFDLDNKGRARAGIAGSTGSGFGARNYSAEIARDEDAVSLNANAGTQLNRFDLSAQQTVQLAQSGGRISDSRTVVRAAFSLSYAGGTLALGRPVAESFLIARTHSTLAGKRVLLDPANDQAAAQSDALGAATLGQITAYSRRTVTYAVPDAPAGYDLGAGNVTLRPRYKSGYLLTIGSDYNLLVVGKLVDADGSPVALLAGKAIELSNAKRQAITVFTTRDGRFGAQGLRPGRWRIEMPADEPLAYEFTVTASEDGTARVGTLAPVATQGQDR